MKNFDKNRFWQVLKWNVITDKKQLLSYMLALAGAWLVLQLIHTFALNDISLGLGETAASMGMHTCLGFSIMVMMYYASGMLGNARTQRERTNMLMLPASNMEKFLARAFYCLVIIPVLIVIGLIVATLVRMGIELVFGHEGINSALPDLFSYFTTDISGNLIGHLFLTSIFMLGGVLFSKHSFIWTWISIIAISMVAGLIVAAFMVGKGADHVNITITMADTVFSVIAAVLTVFNVVMSYWLFCRLQIVQHKWFNV